jgi:hypothetical protein
MKRLGLSGVISTAGGAVSWSMMFFLRDVYVHRE